MTPDGEEIPAREAGSSPKDVPGATANSPWAMPWAAWKEILKRVYTMWGFHNLSLLGAGVAVIVWVPFARALAREPRPRRVRS